MSISYKLFQRIEAEKIFPNLFYGPAFPKYQNRQRCYKKTTGLMKRHASDQIPHPFMIKKKKPLSKLEIEWNFLNVIKNIYQKTNT